MGFRIGDERGSGNSDIREAMAVFPFPFSSVLQEEELVRNP